MNLADFLDRVIEDGIAAARADYCRPEQKAKLEGSIEGFEACRGKDPEALAQLAARAAKDTELARMHLHEDEISAGEYWKKRCREAGDRMGGERRERRHAQRRPPADHGLHGPRRDGGGPDPGRPGILTGERRPSQEVKCESSKEKRFMQEFGELIRSLRKAKGLTLEEVAEKVGTKKGYISGIENNKVNPPAPDKVRKLAKVLGGDRVLFLLLATIEKAPPETQEILRRGVKLALEGTGNGAAASSKEAATTA